MLAEVYFAQRRASAGGGLMEKIEQLCDAAGLATRVAAGDRVALKTDFGERGNTTHVRPEILRRLIGRLQRLNARPFVTDTNARLSRTRQEATGHLLTAAEHGFTLATLGAPVLIADGLDGTLFTPLAGGPALGEIRVAEAIAGCDALLVVNHVTLHPELGLAGALHHLGVGALARQAKLELSAGVMVSAGRGRAPESPLAMELTEVLAAVLAAKAGKTLFFNLLTEITPDPDGQAWSDAAIVPDVGLMVSTDPVALDQASADMLNAQPGLPGTRLEDPEAADKIRAIYPQCDWGQLLQRCEAAGLGTRDYELLIL